MDLVIEKKVEQIRRIIDIIVLKFLQILCYNLD